MSAGVDEVVKGQSGTVRPVRLEEVRPAQEGPQAVVGQGLELVQGVKVRLTVAVGGTQMSVGELLALKQGGILVLDKSVPDPVDVYLDAKLVARGELMVAGENFAVKITEIAPPG